MDLWRSSSAAYGENGSLAGGYDYNTYKFTREAVSIVEAHPVERPLFIYLAYQNVHGPIQAPSNYTALYDAEIYHPRLMCLAMIAAVDESIGKVTQALQTRGLWNNTLVIFSSDNGVAQWASCPARPGPAWVFCYVVFAVVRRTRRPRQQLALAGIEGLR